LPPQHPSQLLACGRRQRTEYAPGRMTTATGHSAPAARRLGGITVAACAPPQHRDYAAATPTARTHTPDRGRSIAVTPSSRGAFAYAALWRARLRCIFAHYLPPARIFCRAAAEPAARLRTATLLPPATSTTGAADNLPLNYRAARCSCCYRLPYATYWHGRATSLRGHLPLNAPPWHDGALPVPRALCRPSSVRIRQWTGRWDGSGSGGLVGLGLHAGAEALPHYLTTTPTLLLLPTRTCAPPPATLPFSPPCLPPATYTYHYHLPPHAFSPHLATHYSGPPRCLPPHLPTTCPTTARYPTPTLPSTTTYAPPHAPRHPAPYCATPPHTRLCTAFTSTATYSHGGAPAPHYRAATLRRHAAAAAHLRTLTKHRLA